MQWKSEAQRQHFLNDKRLRKLVPQFDAETPSHVQLPAKVKPKPKGQRK